MGNGTRMIRIRYRENADFYGFFGIVQFLLHQNEKAAVMANFNRLVKRVIQYEYF